MIGCARTVKSCVGGRTAYVVSMLRLELYPEVSV